jgi:hypothetical protein
MSGAVKMTKRLYLTADGSRVVEDGDPEAATLLCPAGGFLSHADAARYGLLPDAAAAEAAAEREPDTEADEESKQEKKAPAAANKAAKRPADKGA